MAWNFVLVGQSVMPCIKRPRPGLAKTSGSSAKPESTREIVRNFGSAELSTSPSTASKSNHAWVSRLIHSHTQVGQCVSIPF